MTGDGPPPGNRPPPGDGPPAMGRQLFFSCFEPENNFFSPTKFPTQTWKPHFGCFNQHNIFFFNMSKPKVDQSNSGGSGAPSIPSLS